MIVELPDGKTAEFPDDMSPDDVAQILRKQYISPQREISTITGKAVPTGEERIQQSGQALRTIGPVAGDITGTMIAPQLKGPVMAGRALKFGVRALNLGLRAMGAGAGAGAGSVIGQKMAGQDIDVGEAGREALVGAGGEAGMSMAGVPIKFLGKKIGKPALELMSDITFVGSAAKKRLRDKFINETTDRSVNFIRDLAPESIRKQTAGIDDLGIMVETALDETRAIYGLYEEVLEKYAKENQGVIPLDDTAQFLGDLKKQASKTAKKQTPVLLNNKVVRELGFPPSSPEAVELKKIMENDLVDPKSIEFLLARVFKKYVKDAPTHRAMKEKLKEAVMSDIDKIAVATGEKTAGEIKREADEAFKGIMQFNFIKKLFDKATREMPATGEKVLQPAKLSKLIHTNKRKILKEMPDLWPKLEKEAAFYKDVAIHFKAQGEQFIQGPGAVISRGIGGAAGGVIMGPWGVPVVEGAGLISAYALMSPGIKKIIQKIVKGTKYVAGKPALHLTSQALDFNEIDF